MEYYYTKNGELIGRSYPIDNALSKGYTELAADEFTDAIARLQEEQKAEYCEEQTKDERIAELEHENATLLYKLLTGEDLE